MSGGWGSGQSVDSSKLPRQTTGVPNGSLVSPYAPHRQDASRYPPVSNSRTGRHPTTVSAGAKLEAGQYGAFTGSRAGVWRCRMGNGWILGKMSAERSTPPLGTPSGGRRGRSWLLAVVLALVPTGPGIVWFAALVPASLGAHLGVFQFLIHIRLNL